LVKLSFYNAYHLLLNKRIN